MKNNFFYTKHKFFVKFLKKQGWTEKTNICNYWFNNKPLLLKKLYKKYPIYVNNTGYLDEIETRIRWESELGKNFIFELKSYLLQEQNKLKKLYDPKNPFKYVFTLIDISKIKVKYLDQYIFISQFSNYFKTNSNIGGQIDLRGIPLNNIKIDNISLTNINFSYSNFSNSRIQQCKLYNINFSNCDFSNSHIFGIGIDAQTHFSESNFSNSYIDIFPVKNEDSYKNIGEIKFNKIKYFELLKISFLKLFFNYKKNIKKNYTEFSIDNASFYSKKPENIKYLLWFKKVQERIFNKHDYSLLSNLFFFLQIFLTKYWSSFSSLLCFSFFIISIYALSFYNLILKTNQQITYFDAFYYSITCFKGFGIHTFFLNTNLLKLLSLSENILGYIVLAMIIYLLTQKLNNKY